MVFLEFIWDFSVCVLSLFLLMPFLLVLSSIDFAHYICLFEL